MTTATATISATTTTWDYPGYWAAVLGANRSASDTVANFDLVADEKAIDAWLDEAEVEAWRVGGVEGRVPDSWLAFRKTAATELLAYAKRAADSEDAVENEWNVYVWPTESGVDAYCVGHDADKSAALRLARTLGAEQIQFGLGGDVLPVR